MRFYLCLLALSGTSFGLTRGVMLNTSSSLPIPAELEYVEALDSLTKEEPPGVAEEEEISASDVSAFVDPALPLEEAKPNLYDGESRDDLPPGARLILDAVASPVRAVPMSFLNRGKITEIAARIGEPYLHGDLLASQDQRGLQAEAKSLQHALAQAKATLESENAIKLAEVKLEGAKTALDRSERLYEKRAGTLAQLESDRQKVAEAQIMVQEALHQKTIEQQEVAKLSAQLIAAEVALEERTLKAPFDGEILDIFTQIGDTVDEETKVLEFANLEYVKIRGTIAVEDHASLASGMRVCLFQDSRLTETTKLYEGVLQNVLRQSEVRARTEDGFKSYLTVEAIVRNERDEAGNWEIKPGIGAVFVAFIDPASHAEVTYP